MNLVIHVHKERVVAVKELVALADLILVHQVFQEFLAGVHHGLKDADLGVTHDALDLANRELLERGIGGHL